MLAATMNKVVISVCVLALLVSGGLAHGSAALSAVRSSSNRMQLLLAPACAQQSTLRQLLKGAVCSAVLSSRASLQQFTDGSRGPLMSLQCLLLTRSERGMQI